MLRRSSIQTLSILTTGILAILSHPLLTQAQPLNWDPGASLGSSLGGSGAWDTGYWYDGVSADTLWIDGDDANISGAPGTISLSTAITVGNATFAPTTGTDTFNFQSGANSSTFGSISLTNTTLSVAAGASLTTANGITLNSGSTLNFAGNGAGGTVNGPVVLNGGAIQYASGNVAAFKGLFFGTGDLLINTSTSYGNVLTQTATNLNNTFTGNTTIVNNILQFSGYNATNFTPFGTGTGTTVTLTGKSGSYSPKAGIVFAPSATNSTYYIAQNFAFSSSTGNIAYFQENDGIMHIQGTSSITTDSNAASYIKFITQYNGKDIYLDGVVSGSGAMEVSSISSPYGAGTTHLTNGLNTYNGTITVDDSGGTSGTSASGILSVDSNNAAANASILLTGTDATKGGRLRVNAANVAIANLNGTNASSTVFTTSSTVQTLTINNDQANNFAGSIGVSGSYKYDNYNSTTNAANLALVKNGQGTLTLSGANGYTGSTTVNSGGLLVSGSLAGTSSVSVNSSYIQLGASNVINTNATLVLNGGTFASAGFSQSLGALTIGSGISLIDFGVGSTSNVLSFANSSASQWTGTLSIRDWTGTAGGGSEQLFFGTDNTGLTAGQLAAISFVDPAGFNSGTYAAQMLSTGEIVPIPEPTAVISMLGGLSVLLGYRRRRS